MASLVTKAYSSNTPCKVKECRLNSAYGTFQPLSVARRIAASSKAGSRRIQTIFRVVICTIQISIFNSDVSHQASLGWRALAK